MAISTVKFKGTGEEFPFVGIKTTVFSFIVKVLYNDNGTTKETHIRNVELS